VKLLAAFLLLASCASIPGFFRWRWSRNAEPGVVGYRVETHYAEAFHFPCQVKVCDPGCFLPDPSCCHLVDSTCISYTSTISVLATTEPQPLPSAEVCTDWDSGPLEGSEIPSLDSVLFVDVRAVDSAGNVGD
jgi:hypothetical protein